MWIDSWDAIGRVLLVGAASYGTLVLILRATGKRTLSQLNAFDFVVTVALGSTLATILLSSSVSWLEGLTALILLAGLQFVVAWSSSRLPWLRNLLTTQPALLLADGKFLPDSMKEHRLAESEVRQAVRMQGIGDLNDVRAVILETNGTFSVISSSQYGNGSALEDVRHTGRR
ncbi:MULTISPECIES: YetF domain-containing protein [Kocuria]|uniref:DUF421 domain-containing protein n=1 Tax=Kocuria atrinae TaxID=592377 RepID=A0ABP5J042_9MICC|nr:YetF domain-containing protein [Kocuria carniphila]MDN5700159.1 DUF421 domain-containing protein [Kocuria sp.]